MESEPHPCDLTAYLSRPSAPEREALSLFRREEPLVIFDIGACEGEDSIRFARCFPRARVFAFEPLPANQAIIRQNFKRCGVPNAELVPVALSDREGEALFHVSSGRPPELFAGEDWNYGNKSSSLLPPAQEAPMHGWIAFKEQIRVPTSTLDRFCRDRRIVRVDFIQMDVQGAEGLVLAGGAETLAQTTAVWLEVSERENYRGQILESEMAHTMRGRGFVLASRTSLGDGSGEGDHYYLNGRRPRVRVHLLARGLRSLSVRVLRKFGW